MSAARRRKHRHASTVPADGRPESRRVLKRRYSRLLTRGIAAVFVLLIVAGVAACMFLESVFGPSEHHYHRPGRDELFDRLFEASVEAALGLMQFCGLSDAAIRIALLALIALCAIGIVAVIKLLGWLDPANSRRYKHSSAPPASPPDTAGKSKN